MKSTLKCEINKLKENKLGYKVRSKKENRIILSFLFFINGICLAFLMNNIYLIPVFEIAFFVIPMFIKQGNNNVQETKEIKSILFAITNYYLNTGNLEAAIKESIRFEYGLIREVFYRFLEESQISNETAIKNMKQKIHIPIFQEWCDMLLLSVKDKAMLPLLSSVLKKYDDYNTVKEFYYEKKKIIRNISFILFIFVIFLSVVSCILNENCRIFFFSNIGKLITAIYAAVTCSCLFYLNKGV